MVTGCDDDDGGVSSEYDVQWCDDDVDVNMILWWQDHNMAIIVMMMMTDHDIVVTVTVVLMVVDGISMW